MNQRTRELWYKAAESTAAYTSNPNNSWETQVNFMDKFAQLIVCECVDILMKPEWVMSNHKGLSEYNSGWVSGRLLGIQHIKQHFEAKHA